MEHFFSKATSAAPATSEDPGSRESSSSLLNLAKKGGSQDNRVKDPNKALQHYKIKQDLGLKSIEDFVGEVTGTSVGFPHYRRLVEVGGVGWEPEYCGSDVVELTRLTLRSMGRAPMGKKPHEKKKTGEVCVCMSCSPLVATGYSCNATECASHAGNPKAWDRGASVSVERDDIPSCPDCPEAGRGGFLRAESWGAVGGRRYRWCGRRVCGRSGLRGYLDFLCKGVELLRRQGRYEVAVSLLEAVLVNWRQKRSDGNDAQKRFIKDELEMISLCKR